MAGKPDDDDLPLVGDDGWPLGGPSDAEVKRDAKARFERDMQAALARRGAGEGEVGDLTAFALAIQLYWRQHREFPHSAGIANIAAAHARRGQRSTSRGLEILLPPPPALIEAIRAAVGHRFQNDSGSPQGPAAFPPAGC